VRGDAVRCVLTRVIFFERLQSVRLEINKGVHSNTKEKWSEFF